MGRRRSPVKKARQESGEKSGGEGSGESTPKRDAERVFEDESHGRAAIGSESHWAGWDRDSRAPRALEAGQHSGSPALKDNRHVPNREVTGDGPLVVRDTNKHQCSLPTGLGRDQNTSSSALRIASRCEVLNFWSGRVLCR